MLQATESFGAKSTSLLLVQLLLKPVHDRLGCQGTRAEVHEGHLFFRITEPVVVSCQVLVGQLARPVDHGFVLSLPALILAHHLLVRLVILEEARSVLGVMGQFGISEEVEPVFMQITDPVKLLLTVTMSISVVFLC